MITGPSTIGRGVVGFAFAAFAALTLGACGDATAAASAQDPHGPRFGQRSDALQGGAKDTTSTFAVAVLDDQNGVCSGTLIAPNLVLTARHCVASDDGGNAVDCKNDHFLPPRPASTFRVTTDAVADFDAAAFKAIKIIVPTSTTFCGNDLALLVLDKLVPAAVATPATPAIDPPLTDRAKFGSTLTAIGYGVTAPGANDDGTRRKRANIAINCIPGDTTLGCALADFGMTAAELAGGNGLCEGDSGSGAYEPSSLAAGAPIVIGVLSRAAEDNGQCADSVYGRTDTAGPLLVSAAKDAATMGGYAAPAWADPTGVTKPDAGTSLDDGGAPDETPPATAAADAGPSADAMTTTTSGCATALGPPGRSRDGMPAFGVMLAVAGLAASRRRRARSTPR